MLKLRNNSDHLLMPRRKKKELPFSEVMRRLKDSTMESSKRLRDYVDSQLAKDDVSSLDERVKKLLGIVNISSRKSTDMLFFVMYDIESDKVRTQVSKYLLRKGCFRIQRSIFLADAPHDTMEQIRNDLAEVQECYDNHDSILIVPISTDYLQSMKIIGKTLDIDIIMKNRNTLFF